MPSSIVAAVLAPPKASRQTNETPLAVGDSSAAHQATDFEKVVQGEEHGLDQDAGRGNAIDTVETPTEEQLPEMQTEVEMGDVAGETVSSEPREDAQADFAPSVDRAISLSEVDVSVDNDAVRRAELPAPEENSSITQVLAEQDVYQVNALSEGEIRSSSIGGEILSARVLENQKGHISAPLDRGMQRPDAVAPEADTAQIKKAEKLLGATGIAQLGMEHNSKISPNFVEQLDDAQIEAVVAKERFAGPALPTEDGEFSVRTQLFAEGDRKQRLLPESTAKPDTSTGSVKKMPTLQIGGSPEAEMDVERYETPVEQRLASLSSTLNSLDKQPATHVQTAVPTTGLLQPVLKTDLNVQTEDIDLESVETEFSTISSRLSSPLTSGTASLLRSDMPRHLAFQFQDVLRAMPDKPVEISLQPEELGKVRMSISAGESNVVLTVLAERNETLDLLRRHAEQLSRELAQLGFGSVDLTFGQGENAGTNADEQSAAAGSWSEQDADQPVENAAAIHLGLDTTRALDVRL